MKPDYTCEDCEYWDCGETGCFCGNPDSPRASLLAARTDEACSELRLPPTRQDDPLCQLLEDDQ